MANAPLRTHAILKTYGDQILAGWDRELRASLKGDRRISESELAKQTSEFLSLLQAASAADGTGKVDGPSWAPMRDFLEDVSRSRALQGFTSDETARFVFSFKKPLFDRLRRELGKNPQALAAETWNATELLDRLGMLTVKSFQKAR